MNLYKITALSFICIFFIGCTTSTDTANSAYFRSPESAVPQITEMLKNKDWQTLAKFYDLTDSPVKMESLVSGDFFYTEKKPEFTHPAGFWKYKHPFSPGFKFMSTRLLAEQNVIEVSVQVEIDQGGGMTQRGIQSFLMRKSEKGYQIMPHKAPAL